MLVHGLQKAGWLKAELRTTWKVGSQSICKLVPALLPLSSSNAKVFLVKLK